MHECQDEQSCSGDRYRCPTNFKALTKRCRHDFKALFATTPTARSACGYTEHVRRLLLSGSWSLVTRTKSRGVCNEREVSEWSDLTVLSKPWLISVKCSAEIQYCVLYCIRSSTGRRRHDGCAFGHASCQCTDRFMIKPTEPAQCSILTLFFSSAVYLLSLRPQSGNGALNDDDICLSVCLSVCQSRICDDCKKTGKPFNVKNLRQWKSITGCCVITSLQIQDGGWPLIWKSSVKMIRLWWNLVHLITATKFKFLNSRWRTDAILENISFDDNSAAYDVLSGFYKDFVRRIDAKSERCRSIVKIWKLKNGGRQPRW